MSAPSRHEGTVEASRERRTWWAVDTEHVRVIQTVGLSCAPNNPTIWWVPAVGLSMTEGYHLFKSRPEAVEVLRKYAHAELRRLTKALEVLDGHPSSVDRHE